MKEKKITKKTMIEFARHCMIQLIQEPAEKTETGMPEISSYDLLRISKILNKYNYEKKIKTGMCCNLVAKTDLKSVVQ